ncbi:MAG: hypothetical protein NTX35_09580 [Verrucomicrobia bacterium]|nr:hypothetical protein [Verrucomicrobiota bacterium]
MSEIQTWKTQTHSADAAARQAIATAAIAGDMQKVAAITAALKPMEGALDALIKSRREWQQKMDALDTLTKAEQTKEPQTRLRISINWRAANQNRTEQIIDAPQAAASLVTYIKTLVEVFGSGVLPRLQAIRVLKNALVSQSPQRDFMNPKQGEPYSHHRIGNTGWFVNTNTSTDHKKDQIDEIRKLLGLPLGSVRVEIVKKQSADR